MQLPEALTALPSADLLRPLELLSERERAVPSEERPVVRAARSAYAALIDVPAAAAPPLPGAAASELRRLARTLELERRPGAGALCLAASLALWPTRLAEDALLALLARARLFRDLAHATATLLAAARERDRRGYLHSTLTATYEETLGDHRAAAEAFALAASEFPEALEFLAGWARCLEALREFDALLPVLELQVEREDDPARLSLLHTRLASLLTSLRGDDVRAMHHYRQAIRLVPSFEPPQQGLLVLAEKHRDDATLVDLLKLRLRHETRPRERAALFSRLGEVIAERLGDATRAEGFLERAVQEHPRALLPRLRLLELLCAQGEFARAEAYARAPDHLELGELDRGHFARLCRLCAWVDRERGRPVHAVRALALALETTERPEGVLDEWLELVRTEAPIEPPPETLSRWAARWEESGAVALAAKAWRLFAESAFAWGALEPAERAFRRAISLGGPTPGEALAAYAAFLSRTRRFEEAVKVHLAAAACGGSLGERAVIEAATLLADHLHDPAGALAMLTARLSRQRLPPLAIGLAAQLALREGLLDEAAHALDHAERGTDEPGLRALRAAIARTRGDAPAVVEALEDEAARAGNERAFREVLGRRLAQGRPEAALAALEEVPPSRRARLLVPAADAMRAAGAGAAAVALYRQAVHEGARAAEALGALSVLDRSAAFELVPELVERGPLELRALSVLSSVLAAQGDGEGAQRLYRLASALSDGVPPGAPLFPERVAQVPVPADPLLALLVRAERRFGPLPTPGLALRECRPVPLSSRAMRAIETAWASPSPPPRLLTHPAVGAELAVLRGPLSAVVVSDRLMDPAFPENVRLFAALQGTWLLRSNLGWLPALAPEQLEVAARELAPEPGPSEEGLAPPLPGALLEASIGGGRTAWAELLAGARRPGAPLPSVLDARRRAERAALEAALAATGDLLAGLAAVSLLPPPAVGFAATRHRWLAALGRVPRARLLLGAAVGPARAAPMEVLR